MKKIILASCFCLGALLMQNNAHAQSAVLYGWTTTVGNSSGGTTTTCPPDQNKICTTNTLNPNGTHTITVHHYDQEGNATGTTSFVTKSDKENNRIPDERHGYIHSAQTNQGTYWMKAAN